MINKNELMKEEVERYMNLVLLAHGEELQCYKNCVRDLMLAINKKDWRLYSECESIINNKIEDGKIFNFSIYE